MWPCPVGLPIDDESLVVDTNFTTTPRTRHCLTIPKLACCSFIFLYSYCHIVLVIRPGHRIIPRVKVFFSFCQIKFLGKALSFSSEDVKHRVDSFSSSSGYFTHKRNILKPPIYEGYTLHHIHYVCGRALRYYAFLKQVGVL